MSRVITVLLLVAVAASPREAIVVPVGPKTRTEEEKQCVRQRLEAIVDSSGGGRLSGRPVYALSNESWVESETQTYGVVRQQNFTYFGYHACRVHPTHWLISTQVAGKRLYHPVKCAADPKLGALARGMAQGHNSMETMSTPARQDMLVGALEGFLEDLPSS